MSNKVPNEIALEIKKIVFDEADEANYLAMSRTDSGIFLNRLTSRADVGEQIAMFMKRDQVRHYIKDAILNRYSKDKTKEATPDDVLPVIKQAFGLDAEESHSEGKLGLFLSKNPSRPKEYVVVTEGTYLKWETALKKALIFLSDRPFSETANEVHVLLLLFAQHKPIAPTDREQLQKALSRCGAIPYIFGER